MTTRQAIHAYLSEEAHRAWQQLSDETGVSITGMVEAFGLKLAEDIEAAGGDAFDLHPELVKVGRKVDAERRRRG